MRAAAPFARRQEARHFADIDAAYFRVDFAILMLFTRYYFIRYTARYRFSLLFVAHTLRYAPWRCANDLFHAVVATPLMPPLICDMRAAQAVTADDAAFDLAHADAMLARGARYARAADMPLMPRRLRVAATRHACYARYAAYADADAMPRFAAAAFAQRLVSPPYAATLDYDMMPLFSAMALIRRAPQNMRMHAAAYVFDYATPPLPLR